MRALLILSVVIVGVALQGYRGAHATPVSDYRRASAAIDIVERSGTRLALASAASENGLLRAGDSMDVYGAVLSTEASLELFIGHAGKLVSGDVAEDLDQLAEWLEELKALKDAKADLLGLNGEEAQTRALVRARTIGEGTVATARHMRASIGCLLCEDT